MSEHTKGPWKMSRSGDGKCYAVRGAMAFGYGTIATVDSDDQDAEESASNARLIAAAPDLLEACKLLVRNEREGVDLNSDNEALNAARAAIAKAEGA